jgi:hypothetical protein
MSGFALADQNDVNRGVEKLKKDINNGAWEIKYGHYKQKKSFDAGYRFLVATCSCHN